MAALLVALLSRRIGQQTVLAAPTYGGIWTLVSGIQDNYASDKAYQP